MLTTLRLKPPMKMDPLSEQALKILEREIQLRAGMTIVHTNEPFDLALIVDPALPDQSYRIDIKESARHVIGGNAAGLLYGVGRFLRESRWSKGAYEPCEAIPLSVPDCGTRGMYFAHNFHNWYRSAPLGDLVRYIEDLALWGLNAIAFPCGTNPQCSQEEIEQLMIPKQLELMHAARRLGVSVGLITVANTIHQEPEPAAAATPVGDSTPPRRGNKGYRVCPSTPEGLALLSKRFRESLDDYAAVGLDFVINFPYDEGGCGCERCRPWGGNGYIKASRELSRLARERYAGCRFILATWCFDVVEESEGEYQTLDRSLRRNGSWCDATMVDSHFDFPEWPLQHGKPGGLPMLNFPEISMWGRVPWLGSGANPFPGRLVKLWGQAKSLLDGGFPYSEGCGEDLNKITCLSLYWNKNLTWQEIVTEYSKAYFGHHVINDFIHAVELMESIYHKDNFKPDTARETAHLVKDIEQELPDAVRESWRWRLFNLRAQIDLQIAEKGSDTGELSEKQRDLYNQLLRLYHMEISPPSVMKTRGI